MRRAVPPLTSWAAFAEAWDERDAGYAPRVTVDRRTLRALDVPAAAKTFLSRAGLPESVPDLGMDFRRLREGVRPVPEVHPDRIDNGIEFPPARYALYYALGGNTFDDGTCISIARGTGEVVRLDFGQKTFRETVHNGECYETRPTDRPVLDGRNPIGPYFLASSVPQLAGLLLAYRRFRRGWADLPDRRPRALHRDLYDAFARVDSAAATCPGSEFRSLLDAVADGLFA